MPSARGDFASFYVRSARSPKRIFLPRRHALKGLGAAVSIAVLVAVAATGVSRINMNTITASTKSAPADHANGDSAPKPQPPAHQRAGKRAPSPSLGHKKPKPAPRKHPAAPEAPAPAARPAAQPPHNKAKPAAPKPQRAQIFTTNLLKSVLKPEVSAGEVWVTSTKPVTDLRLTIRIAQTGGVTETGAGVFDQTDGHNTPLPETQMTTSVTRTADAVVFRFTLNDGVTLQPGTYQLQANYSYTGTENSRYTGGDSYTLNGKDPVTGGIDSEKGNFQ